MKRYIKCNESVYDGIVRTYPLIATFTDDLYGKILSLYDQGNGRFALLDDQNKEIVEVREHPNADPDWIRRYVRHIQQYKCRRIPTVKYSPEYDISACSEVNATSKQVDSSTKIQSSYPDFSGYSEAIAYLNAQDPSKVALVEDCRRDIFDAYNNYNEAVEEIPFSRIESSVIRDYRSIAAEQWEDLAMEEVDEVFDKIFDALCIIHADDAASWI